MPNPGDYFVVHTGGWVAKAIRLVTRSTVNHAGLCISDTEMLEADPSKGIMRSSVDKYSGEPGGMIWYGPHSTYDGDKIAEWGVTQIGVKYSFVDIAVLLFVHVFGWKSPRWMLHRLNDGRRLMCSQFVDTAYQHAGIHLFPDGRPPSEVTPADLLDIIPK